MLDITLFRDKPEVVKEGLSRRGLDTEIVDQIRGLDARRRLTLSELESLRGRRNEESKAIGSGSDTHERERKIAAMREVNAQIDALETQLEEIERDLRTRLQEIPNIPRSDVPSGTSEQDNVIVHESQALPNFTFAPLPHWELGPALGIIDFERGVRLSGSRFYLLTGPGARLQRALIQWLLDYHTSRGYREVYPPFVVREECLWNAGQLPKFRDNLYHDVEDDLWLVPTAEVPLTNLHAGEILSLDQLPLHYVAYTPCFRREKMSAGHDVRGIKRGHQFDKVEMYKFTTPETSPEELEAMLADGEAVLNALALPYRVKKLCAGDLGFGSVITYDIEVWAPGCDEWLEVSSISDVGSFQTRRAGIRFRRPRAASTEYAHTLNGSGLGIPRTMIAILENYQQKDGSIRVPEVLRARMETDAIC